MPLSMVNSGKAVKVLAINGSHAMQMRLINLGIMPGVMVQILTRDSSSLLLKISSTRLMVQSSIAYQVQVQ
jgi:Fe2+ transport system protein FeoA